MVRAYTTLVALGLVLPSAAVNDGVMEQSCSADRQGDSDSGCEDAKEMKVSLLQKKAADVSQALAQEREVEDNAENGTVDGCPNPPGFKPYAPQPGDLMVSGAGTEDWGGLYKPKCTTNGKPQYWRYGGATGGNLWWQGHNWAIGIPNGNDIAYTNSASLPTQGSWQVATVTKSAGEWPAPSVTVASDTYGAVGAYKCPSGWRPIASQSECEQASKMALGYNLPASTNVPSASGNPKYCYAYAGSGMHFSNLYLNLGGTETGSWPGRYVLCKKR
jgi:hypothetical protein